MADPNEGFYYDSLPPHMGLKLACRKLPNPSQILIVLLLDVF